PTDVCTLSLHDALPICERARAPCCAWGSAADAGAGRLAAPPRAVTDLRNQRRPEDCPIFSSSGKVELEFDYALLRYFLTAPLARAMPWPGRCAIWKWPSLQGGISSNRSGGVQSMNSTRKPLASAPTTCSESSCTTCGETATECAAARRAMRSVSL